MLMYERNYNNLFRPDCRDETCPTKFPDISEGNLRVLRSFPNSLNLQTYSKHYYKEADEKSQHLIIN